MDERWERGEVGHEGRDEEKERGREGESVALALILQLDHWTNDFLSFQKC